MSGDQTTNLDSQMITPLPGLTHSKVPLSAWLGESFAFGKRYFRRLFLLCLIMAAFAYLAAPENGQRLIKRAADKAKTTMSLSDGAVDADADIIDDGGAAAEKDADSSRTSDTDTVKAAAPECSVRACCFGIIAAVFGWMVLSWGLRTARKDDPAWKNLLLPSWKTVPKLIALGFLAGCVGALLFLCLILTVGFLHPGIAFIAAALLCCIFLVRIAIASHLIIDRDCGPIRAISGSWKLMRSNCWTLILGVAVAFLAICILGTIVFLLTPTSDSAGTFLTGTVTVITNALAQVCSVSLASIFYLMATGQPRPGAWPRENTESAE